MTGTAPRPRRALRDPIAARRADLEAARAGVDVVFVGGGITGTGAARDATMRGLKVALVEKGDWASGTSSKSSKLVHGGLRYLENMQFGLVMEGTRERYRQQVLNPHLVTPLRFAMPVYKPGRHSLFKINIGLWLYDLLSLFRTPRIHKKLGHDKTRAAIPVLRDQGLAGSIIYYDCATDDARLTLANALDARRRGALAFSRMRYLGPVERDGRVVAARMRDEVPGEGAIEIEVPCRHIVHATGPWTDDTGALVGDAARLRPTKGVHIVVARERLPLDLAVAMSSVDDGRVVFAIPFGNTTYIGTTDTDYPGRADEVVATPEDVTYILRTANHFFPGSGLVPSDVRSTWAGLRPLIRSDAATAYKTSREHEIYSDPRGITTIAGGKLTTYRAMAEELVDQVVKDLKHDAKRRGEAAPKLARCKTHKAPLDAIAAAAVASHTSADGTEPAPAVRDALETCLWHTHGSLADAVRDRMESHPGEAARISPDLPYVLAQVAIAAREEDAWDLEDLLVRRLQVFYRASDAGLAAAEPAARILARELGRDDAWVASEVRRYQRYVRDQLACARVADASAAHATPFEAASEPPLIEAVGETAAALAGTA
ncbi:MAG: glycerol-3-phosphate dehydrogenase/oxidase [Deltaproteobacteria bacterium]|nr:glycerol-3-phosphate dehydrogenase/oxidase [Deltaproteobacteria bacterium]